MTPSHPLDALSTIAFSCGGSSRDGQPTFRVGTSCDAFRRDGRRRFVQGPGNGGAGRHRTVFRSALPGSEGLGRPVAEDPDREEVAHWSGSSPIAPRGWRLPSDTPTARDPTRLPSPSVKTRAMPYPDPRRRMPSGARRVKGGATMVRDESGAGGDRCGYIARTTCTPGPACPAPLPPSATAPARARPPRSSCMAVHTTRKRCWAEKFDRHIVKTIEATVRWYNWMGPGRRGICQKPLPHRQDARRWSACAAWGSPLMCMRISGGKAPLRRSAAIGRGLSSVRPMLG